MLININQCFIFRVQVPAILLFFPLLDGWHLIVHTQKSSPAYHMVCCSHVQTQNWRAERCLCVHHRTGESYPSATLTGNSSLPEFIWSPEWKKKSLSVTKSIRQNNFKHFLQLCSKQWAEFRAQMQAVMNFFYRTQKRLWSYVYPMHTFGACHCTAILPVVRKVRGHSGSILPMHLKTWKRGKWGIQQGIIHFSFGNFKRKFVPHRLIPAVELMVATLFHSS